MPLMLKQFGQLILEFLLDVVRFPYWWYTGGLLLVGHWCKRGFQETVWRLSLGLFVKHLFTPMYGDYSKSGRAISLIIRLVILMAKFIRLLAATIWYFAILLGWCLLFPLTLIMLLSRVN